MKRKLSFLFVFTLLGLVACDVQKQCYGENSLQAKADLLQEVISMNDKHEQFINVFNECGNSNLCLVPQYGELPYKEQAAVIDLSSRLLQQNVSSIIKKQGVFLLPFCENFNSKKKKYYLVHQTEQNSSLLRMLNASTINTTKQLKGNMRAVEVMY